MRGCYVCAVGAGDAVEGGFPHVGDEGVEGEWLLGLVDGGYLGAADAGVTDEHVDGGGVVGFLNCGDGGRQGIFGSYVALDWVDVVAGDAGGGFLEGFYTAAEDEDMRGTVQGESAGHHCS